MANSDDSDNQQDVSFDNEVRLFVPAKPLEQIQKRKTGNRVSWNWHDTWQEAHKQAFVVAKMARADLLQTMHDSLQSAIKEGWTFEQWRKYITPKLEGQWLGKTIGELWDELPDEEKAGRKPPTAVQRESVIMPRRLETIFRTNTAVAYAAGRYEHHMAVAKNYPYWRYNTREDSRVRASHAAMNGKVFRFDDPIWQTHYPPNGWGCRCYVEALDDWDMEDQGLTCSSSEGRKVVTEDQNGNEVIGYDIDGRVMFTAPGWGYNPALLGSKSVEATARQKAVKMAPEIRKELLADLDNIPEHTPTTNSAKAQPDEFEAKAQVKAAEKAEASKKGVAPVVAETANPSGPVVAVPVKPTTSVPEAVEPPAKAKSTTKKPTEQQAKKPAPAGKRAGKPKAAPGKQGKLKQRAADKALQRAAAEQAAELGDIILQLQQDLDIATKELNRLSSEAKQHEEALRKAFRAERDTDASALAELDSAVKDCNLLHSSALEEIKQLQKLLSDAKQLKAQLGAADLHSEFAENTSIEILKALVGTASAKIEEWLQKYEAGGSMRIC